MSFILTDISFYQYGYTNPPSDWTITRYIDFEKMRRLTSAVIIRAGQNLWKDRAFDISWQRAKEAGLHRGCYWFYDSRVSPNLQAELWIKIMNGDLGELPLWCDSEDNYKGAYGGWKNFYNFIEALKKLAPKKEIGVYTNYYYWLENTIASPTGISNASLNYFKQYPLWIAAYNNLKPTVPKPWTDWAIWQYTDNGDGKLYGVESLNIDLNYFNGDEEAFRARFGLGATVQPSLNGKPIIQSMTLYLNDDEVVNFIKE